jgi:hypothetical protein
MVEAALKAPEAFLKAGVLFKHGDAERELCARLTAPRTNVQRSRGAHFLDSFGANMYIFF